MISGRSIAARFAVFALVGSMLGLGLPGLAAAAPEAPTSPATPAGSLIPVMSAVWCAGSRPCLAVGTNAQSGAVAPVSAVWNSRSWRFVSTPDKGNELAALSCTSFTDCMAVGGSGVADHWNGTSWRLLSTPVKSSLIGVACPGRELCLAISGTAAIVWRGRAWRASYMPSPKGSLGRDLTSVSCWSATNCLAVGGYTVSGGPTRPMAVGWNGKKWRLLPAPPQLADAVACPAHSHCLATAYGYTQLWNGRSWRAIKTNFVVPDDALSCPSTSFCMLNNNYQTHVWNGASWSQVASPETGDTAVWCGSTTNCMVVGGQASHWNGKSWTTMRLVKYDQLDGVSCASPTACVALGRTNVKPYNPNNAALAERWDGTGWRLFTGPPSSIVEGASVVPLMSCPTASFCMTLAGRWNGHRWISTPLPSFGGYPAHIEALSCASATECVATGDRVALAWNGTRWTVTNAGISGQFVDLSSDSCSGGMCLATGVNYSNTCTNLCPTDRLAEQWNGKGWQIILDTSSGSDDTFSVVSCGTATYCLAEYGSMVMTWSNGTWTQVPSPSLGVFLRLSCGSPTSCMGIVSYNVPPEVWNGTAWTVTKPKAAGSFLADVSCTGTGTSTCVLVGFNGNLAMAQRWNGTSWSLTKTVSP